jgi:hypothetical protein
VFFGKIFIFDIFWLTAIATCAPILAQILNNTLLYAEKLFQLQLNTHAADWGHSVIHTAKRNMPLPRKIRVVGCFVLVQVGQIFSKTLWCLEIESIYEC